MSSYDAIAELYDPWNRSVTEDVDFYVAEARKDGGPVVELGVGTGRIAVPIARAGVRVVGVDSSKRMLDLCRRRAEEAGVSHLVDLREGDLRRPPLRKRVSLVTSPFRSLLHLPSDEARLQAFAAIHKLLEPEGRSRRAPPTSRRRTTAGSSGSQASGSTQTGTWTRVPSSSP